MIYKTFGKTGKEVSAIGFGGMRFGPSREEALEVVHKASELGINYFDTAPYYCDDKSEEIFGEAFRAMPNPFYISTKSNERTAGELRQRLETSLRRLGVPKIDFFHLWCVLSLDDYRARLVAGGAYEGAVKAKKEGLIEHLCISTHASGEEIAIIAAEGLFDGITLGYNACNFPFRRTGLLAAHARGMGVVTMNPLGGGLIPQNEKHFSFLRRDRKESIAQAALRFNASHREITVALAGMGTVAEVIENVAAMEGLREMSEAEIMNLQDNVSEKLDSLCTGCNYCASCPEGIEIPKFMDSYNIYLLNGDLKEIDNRLKWHWGIPSDNATRCLACGQCEDKCTQHLPIIERLKVVASREGKVS